MWGKIFLFLAAVVIAVAAFGGGYLVQSTMWSDLPYEKPKFNIDGTVRVPSFDLPPSNYMSEGAKAFLKTRVLGISGVPSGEGDIESVRRNLDLLMSPAVSQVKNQYPVNIAEETIAGVPTRVFTPAEKDFDPDRVIINFHGGGFSVCWDGCSILESVPVSVLGGYKVVSVNYRMAPEATHPAGLEDALAVYRELLKDYDAKHIGMYGCSAGGSLTAQSVSALTANNEPAPGAIGIFGAGAVNFSTGDSSYVAAYIDGSFPPPSAPDESDSDESRPEVTRGYFANADMEGPVLSAAMYPDVIAKFPPTMLITGTRAMDLSPAIYTNSRLIKAGVPTRLIVGEGMGHCYLYMSNLPEAQDAHAATVAFFKENLR
jgi:acetyl esterase/lipase